MNWLLKNKCDVVNATYIVETFSTEEIINAQQYVEKQNEIKRKQNKILSNPMGYLRKTLENKWWIQKTPCCDQG